MHFCKIILLHRRSHSIPLRVVQTFNGVEIYWTCWTLYNFWKGNESNNPFLASILSKNSIFFLEHCNNNTHKKKLLWPTVFGQATFLCFVFVNNLYFFELLTKKCHSRFFSGFFFLSKKVTFYDPQFLDRLLFCVLFLLTICIFLSYWPKSVTVDFFPDFFFLSKKVTFFALFAMVNNSKEYLIFQQAK